MRQFANEYPDAVVLGGWSTYLRTGVAKSHDIDIIVDHPTLERLKANHQLSASQHVSGRKFELRIEGVEVDVYPVYQSKLGQKLGIPVEVLIGQTDRIHGVRVLTPEAQVVAKMAALLDRPDSLAGEKDRRELVALFKAGKGPDIKASTELLRRSGWPLERQQEVWAQTFDFLLEAPGLTGAERTMLKMKKVHALRAIRTNDREGPELER